MKNRLTKNQLEQLIREQLTEEIRQQLNENFMRSLKDGFASMFGKQTSKEKEAAEEKLRANLAKEGNERVDKFIDDLGKQYDLKQYPIKEGNEGKAEFLAINENVWAFYLSLKEAVDLYQEGKGAEEQPEKAIHSDIANKYVNLLQQFLFNAQNKLAGGQYQYVEENNEEESDEVLSEIDWEKEAQKIADEEGDTNYFGKEAESTKQLKSNKAPLALALLGLSSAAWGYRLFGMAAIGSEYVPSEFITDPGKYAEMETQIGKYSDVIMNSEGNGFLQTFRDAATSTDQLKLNNDFFVDNVDKIAEASGKTPEFIITQSMKDLGRESFKSVSGEMGTQLYEFAKTAGGGEASAKIVNSVVKEGAISPDFIEFVKGNGGSAELLKSIGAEGATASGAVPDAGQTILGMNPGGGKTAIIGKLITKAGGSILKTGSVTMVAGSVLGGATLAAAAVALGGIGIGLLASAAAVKALREYGKRNSREAALKFLREEMKPFEPKDPVLDPKPEQGGEEGPGAGVYEEGSACAQLVQPLRDLDLKVGDTFRYTTSNGEEKTAMVLATEGMPAIVGWSASGVKTGRTIDYEEQCQQENGRFVQGPNMITFNEGPGTRLEEILSEDELDEAQSAKLKSAMAGVRRDANKKTPQEFLKKYGIKRKPKMAYKFAKELSKEEQKQLIDYTKKIRSKVTKASTEKAIGRELKPELIKVANVPENVGQSYLSNIIDPDGARVRKGKSDEGISPNAKLPEGFKAELNIRDINRGDENFEAFLKSYTDQLVNGEFKQSRVKRWTDVMVPELRKRRGMSADKPKDEKPATDGGSSDITSATPSSGGSTEKSALSGGSSLDDLLGVGPTGIKNQRGGGAKVKRKAPSGTKPGGSASLRRIREEEELEELQETLDRWAQIAGIIKESKNG